jgi:two-component system response regulator YesN
MTIREGIAAAIDWKDYGFDLCGQAGDGEEAFQLIEQLKPDIVISDIHMPRMTGLDLAREAKQVQPFLEFIFLSGHNDFAYAKSALQLGVNDYLLKPCKPEELLDILLRTKQKIVKTREAEHSLSRSLVTVMENALGRWLRSPKQPLENRAEQLGKWHCSLQPNHVFVGIVRFDETARKGGSAGGNGPSADLELIRYAAENIMKETLESAYQAPAIVFRHGQDFIWIANEPSFKLITVSDHKMKLSELQNNLERFLHVSVSMGIGELVPSVDALHVSYDQAAEAVSARFYEGRGSMVFYAELRDSSTSDSATPWDNKSMETLEQDILHHLRILKFEEALDQTEMWLEHLRRNPHLGQSGASLKTTAFLLELQKLAQEQNAAVFEWKLQMVDWLKHLPQIETLDDLATLVKTLIRSLVAVLTSQTPTHRTVQAALDVIHAKYTTNLSLDSVSKEVYVSNTYLSSLFKQELGVNFLDYLHQFRIEQAKLLLKKNYKIFAIAKMVGYQEERHFSTTFKKWTGLTPSQFQKSV